MIEPNPDPSAPSPDPEGGRPTGQPARDPADARPGEVAWTHSLLQQPWWLDAVAPGRWEEVLVRDRDAVVGRLPYALRRRAGLTAITQPPLTQALGPWIATPEGKRTTAMAVEKRVMGQLIEQLPPFSAFEQAFAPEVENWLPFYWAGFRASPRYTYRLEDLSDLDALWSGLTTEARRKIRRAGRTLEVTTEPDLGRLTALTLGRLQRKGVRVRYDAALIGRLDAACARRDARRMFFATDPAGTVRGALYLVWDERSAYYLMGAHAGEGPGDGALSLLMWEAIRFAATVTRKFDFEGSMIEPVERFFRSFGASQVPYLHVSKISRGLRPLWSLRATVRRPPRTAGARLGVDT